MKEEQTIEGAFTPIVWLIVRSEPETHLLNVVLVRFVFTLGYLKEDVSKQITRDLSASSFGQKGWSVCNAVNIKPFRVFG